MTDQPLGMALRCLADAWDEQRRSAYAQLQTQGTISRLPDLSEAGARRRSSTAGGLLARMDALATAPLPHAVELLLRQARHSLRSTVKEAEWYWTVMDPAGLGFFGMFATGAYCGGFLLNFALQSAAAYRFETDSDLDGYLGFVADFARLVEQMAERTEGQARRGMRIPRPQLPAARAVVSAFKARSLSALRVDPGRLPETSTRRRFDEELGHRIDARVQPAFDRWAGILSSEYEGLAPEAVGLAQYDGGAEVYVELVRIHTTTTLTPQEVHERGLARMDEVLAEMRAIRAEVGLADEPAAYLERVGSDPRFRADTTEAVAAVFQRYIDRMDRVLETAFHRRPQAGHGVAPLPEALQASMTFGYYDTPKPGQPMGRFMFNAANLCRQPLLNIGSLTYHELVPGHHLHIAMQSENPSLHPVGRHSFVNAYNEGWAEYAATLAGELGLYETPEEQYGRLIMDAFLTSRLVVDTGMNALGWSLERAREYMRTFSSISEAEVLTESLRYSCDIPGQALAYKLGDTAMLALREKMRRNLGSRFDLRDFHDAVLSPGALPLPDLAWHLDQFTSGRLAIG